MEQRKECQDCNHKCMDAVAYNSIYCQSNREYDNNKENKNKNN